MHNSGNHHAHLWSFNVCAAKVNIQVDGNKLCNWLDNTFPHNFRSNLDLLELENTFQHHIRRSCSRFGWNLYLREFGRSHFLGTLSPGAFGECHHCPLDLFHSRKRPPVQYHLVGTSLGCNWDDDTCLCWISGVNIQVVFLLSEAKTLDATFLNRGWN